MAHEHHGLAFTMAMKGVEHLGFAQAVEIRRRFVQQHERREKDKQRKRRKKRIEKLREVRAEIHLELFDSFDAYLHGLAARNALRVRRAHFDKLVVDFAANELFRLAGNLGAHTLRGNGSRNTNGDACSAQEKKGLTGQTEPGQGVGSSRRDDVGLRQGLLDKQSEGHENHDIGHKSEPFQTDDSGNLRPEPSTSASSRLSNIDLLKRY